MKFGFRIFSCFCFLSLTAWGSSEVGYVTPEAVGESLREHAAQWESAVQSHEPRLFYDNEKWLSIASGIESMAGARADYRERFFAEADRLLKEPVPQYLPPEKVAGTRGDARTLYSAREELWQRDVGNQIYGYAFAVRLRPDNESYRARLHDLVMAATQYQTWGRHDPPMGANADLAAGHIGRGIALAYDWHRDLFSDDERAKIRQTMARRMPNLLRALYGDAYWARGYEENHNHVSVTALAYSGIAFYDEIPSAPIWLAAARLNFINVGRSMAADGSSVEGVSYWTYGMEYILQFIEATRPIIDSETLYDLPFLQNAASYRLMASTSGLGGNLLWGDAVARDWHGPHHILFGLASVYDDPDAAYLAENIAYPLNGGLDQYALQMLWASLAPTPEHAPEQLDHRLTVNDMITTRSGWAEDDYLLSMKAGYTNRNHSHLDAGALTLAFGDDWLLTAPGYGKGGGESNFWQRHGPRWEYFSNATESHATLLINGKNQRFDNDAKAVVTSFLSAPDWSWATADLAGAYNDVSDVQRAVLHHRSEYILVFDYIRAPSPVAVEWLAHFRYEPTASDGGLLINGKKGDLFVRSLVPAEKFSPREPTKEKVDVKMERHLGYAIAQEGSDLSFATLLQPIAKGSAVQPLETKVIASGPDYCQLTVSNGEWTDMVAWQPEKPEQPIMLGAANLQAKAVALRTIDGAVSSLITMGAQQISFAGFEFQSKEPRDFAARLGSDGVWEITAIDDRDEPVVLTDGMRAGQ
ncbi:heparinase II/III domain-containing protein [Cerasicoccus fimbriatus]|uniref:heparinase II/III domain-containing protein n=1 Tax=Cerasicoccus fimbriatus TaxID=3014554 RepID=UPI0022B3BC42|nr:heparinase II/III family protein [Cerasicoccus sp. TK19100]